MSPDSLHNKYIPNNFNAAQCRRKEGHYDRINN